MADFTTNLGASLTSAGSDFGSLIKGVGNSVAQTQLQLAQTSANTAKALANTVVGVVAVQETVYDDAGNIQAAQSFTQRLPLIDLVDPTLYEWTQVRVQGMFFINEIAGANDATSSTFSSLDNSGQHGLLVILGGGQTGVRFSTTSSTQSAMFDQAEAVGVARMYAQLNPRHDIGVPKPTQVIQGPSVNIVEGQIVELPGQGAPPTTRTMSLLIQVHRNDGTPIQGAAVSIDTDGIPWSFSDPSNSTTDAQGNLAISLQRTFLAPPPNAPPPDSSPKAVVITARLGMVSNSTTVTL